MARWPWQLALLTLLSLIVVATALPESAGAHAVLERSTPSQGAALGSPPARVDLWFTESLAPTGSVIQVYDAERHEVDKGDETLDPNDTRHLSVSLNPIVDGTYTVAWSSASSSDGHTIQGSFTFSVGVSRLPGAAASTNEHPSPGAVALRWLVFIGLALAAGWFLLRLLGVSLSATRREVILGGALLAIVSDLALLPVQALWPGAGLPTQSLADTFATMPSAWLIRLAFEIAILALVLAVVVLHRKDFWIALAGVALTAGAIIELALTTHAAARTSYRLPTLLVEITHLESVAFWLGGLALFALLPGAMRADTRDPLRRFSRLVVILAPLGIASGILNAGIILPSLSSLWDSSYGKILLVKIAFVVGIGVFAWLNRRAVQRGVALAARFMRSLRAEMAFSVVVILAASLLSLWAPPEAAKIVPLDLSVATGQNQFAHVVITPVKEGPNRIEAWLSDADGAPVGDLDTVVAGFSMLERPIDLPDRPLTAEAGGRWSAEHVPFTVQGWWRISLNFFNGVAAPVNAQFYVMVPDPALDGGLEHRSTDKAAQTIFQSALQEIETLTSMQTAETLADGVGHSIDTQMQYAVPDKFAYQTASHNASVIIGKSQWFRVGDGPWTKSDRVDTFVFPHTLTTFYNGAAEFTLGRIEMLDGEECQIITFSVPAAPGQGAAWYAWWVGTQTNLLRREVMVADSHFMTNHNIEFNVPVTIDPPATSTP